jgi:hypothetical protein
MKTTPQKAKGNPKEQEIKKKTELFFVFWGAKEQNTVNIS